MSNVTTTTVSVSWQQELPPDGLMGYIVKADYVGPCTPLGGTPMNLPIASRNHTFSGLSEFGTYDVTITAISATMTNVVAMSTITVQTAPAGKQFASALNSGCGLPTRTLYQKCP